MNYTVHVHVAATYSVDFVCIWSQLVIQNSTHTNILKRDLHVCFSVSPECARKYMKWFWDGVGGGVMG